MQRPSGPPPRPSISPLQFSPNAPWNSGYSKPAPMRPSIPPFSPAVTDDKHWTTNQDPPKAPKSIPMAVHKRTTAHHEQSLAHHEQSMVHHERPLAQHAQPVAKKQMGFIGQTQWTKSINFPHLEIEWAVHRNNQNGLFIRWGSCIWASIDDKTVPLVQLTTMSLVALDCLAHLQVISVVHRDIYSDDIYIKFDKEAFTRALANIEPKCEQFYESFVNDVPDFQWGQQYPTKHARLHGDYAFVSNTQYNNQCQRTYQCGLTETCLCLIRQMLSS